METNTRIKVIGIALAIALAFVACAQAVSIMSPGSYQTGVFSKSYGYGTWIDINTATYKTMLSISLPNVPIRAYYHVVCDGYAGIVNAELEIAIGVDGMVEDQSTRRFYGQDGEAWLPTGIHTERTYSLAAGAHTFYFMGKRFGGTGYATTNYHTIVVTVFTDGSVIGSTTITPQTAQPDGR